MKDDKAERLLKIAEKDPELAHKIADFMNEGNGQGSSSGEPLAVKVVKDEEDKIEITPEQKRYAIGYVVCIGISALSIIITFLSIFLSESRPNIHTMKTRIVMVVGLIFICTALSGFCAYKAGMPTIKKYLSRHFKW